MGKRPLFVPAVVSEHDQFGLPNSWLLIENSEQKAKRTARVNALIIEVFEKAIEHLGEDQAKELFVRATKKPRGKRGRQKGLSPERDRLLLQAYFDEVHNTAGDISHIPKLVSKRTFDREGTTIGQSADAIEKHLRRLLIRLEQQAAERVAEHRQWLEDYKEQMGEYPAPTLLEAVPSAPNSDKK